MTRPTSTKALKRLANRIEQVTMQSADRLPSDFYRRARDLAIDARLAADNGEASCRESQHDYST